MSDKYQDKNDLWGFGSHEDRGDPNDWPEETGWLKFSNNLWRAKVDLKDWFKYGRDGVGRG
jgi:hypothetical protein